MNFFDAQARARRRTFALVILFGVTVILMTLALSFAAQVAIFIITFSLHSDAHQSFQGFFSTDAFILITLIMTLAVGYFSYRGFSELFDGGTAVAKRLGAQHMGHSSNDIRQKRAKQIVTEISLAAGCPVPSVFMVDEDGINSFVAGWDVDDAMIAITRGALQHLDRHELQALVAHEFSHILNGDMRLNFIMSGLLDGFFFIYEHAGRLLEGGREGMHHHGSSYRGGGRVGGIYLAAIVMMIVGGLGNVLGRLIQSILTRQQSYAADAAAVQFTRNADAVMRMLEKLGVNYNNAYIMRSRYEKYSHAFIGSAGKRNLLSSHPRLEKRIRRIDPDREITLKAINIDIAVPHIDEQLKKKDLETQIFMWTALGVGLSQAFPRRTATQLNEQVFDPQEWQNPDTTHGKWTDSIQQAEATVLALICAGDPGEESSRLKQLKPLIGGNLFLRVHDRIPDLREMDSRLRVPLLEMCVDTLRETSKVHYQDLKKWMNILFNTDFKIDHDEFMIQRLIISRLDKHFGLAVSRHKILRVVGDVKNEYELVLSLIAYAEHPDIQAKTAFKEGQTAIGASSLAMIPRNQLRLKAVDKALDTLVDLPPMLKERLLKACAAIIALDGKVTLPGFELLRVISISLGIPMPILGSDTRK